MWIPELKNVPKGYIHSPWDMPKSLQTKLGVQVDEKHTEKTAKFYPYPIKGKYTTPEAAAKRAKEFKAERAKSTTNSLTELVKKVKKV